MHSFQNSFVKRAINTADEADACLPVAAFNSIAVAFAAALADGVVLVSLNTQGFGLLAANFAGLAVASVVCFVLDRGLLRDAPPLPGQIWRFLALFALVFLLQNALIAHAVTPPEALRTFAAIAISGSMIAFGYRRYVLGSRLEAGDTSFWIVLSLGTFAYVIALRLATMNALNLLPEEAYYWNYAQHIDIGYLDHPPMVAWLIWIGVHAFGNSEFAVRSMAIVCWLLTAGFAALLTRNMYGRNAATISILFTAALPFFFSTGLVMLPDAPLTAAWAGTLVCLERALIGGNGRYWLLAGIAAGLGFLSKYSIVLLGPAVCVFLILDPVSRYWLQRSEPYLAAAIALTVAAPVIIWNFDHDWISFRFQSTRRIEGGIKFSLHYLIASILFLLTPVALLEAFGAAASFGRNSIFASDRRTRFVIAFTAAPLAVFLAFSIFHGIKLNWTGPVWLATVPWFSWLIVSSDFRQDSFGTSVRKAWEPTLVAFLLAYAIVLNVLVQALPATPILAMLDYRTFPSLWKSIGAEAENIERSVRKADGRDVVMVGMDKYFVSSELAFYDTDNDGASNTAGRGLFGADSLMYDYWFKPSDVGNRDMILVGLKREELSAETLQNNFAQLGPINVRDLYRGATKLGSIYYRVGRNYIAATSPARE